MYAVAFDMRVDDLRQFYGNPYNQAYDEIRQEMDDMGFECAQGSLYIKKNDKD